MGPLAGIRVADFSNHAAGPQATMFLGLLGADVIRIESRRRLDIQRRPHAVYGRDRASTFDHLGLHKRSITLDLKSGGGHALALELVAVADVVVENFRPGVMARLGLSWDDCTRVNPRIVMVSLSTNGQEGPAARAPGYAPIFAAAGALGWITGYRNGPPVEIRNMMDHTAGLYACFAVLAALHARELSGQGRYVDLSAREVAITLAGESVVHGLRGQPVTRMGNEHENWVPHGVFPCSGDDRWLAIVCTNDREWATLASHIAEPWATSSTYRAVRGRIAHRRDLEDRVARWTGTQDRDRLAEELQARGLAAERSFDARDLVADSHLGTRCAIVEVSHPAHGRRRTVGSPWHLKGAAVVPTWSPELGAHNEAVLCGLLGHTTDELAGWIRDGIVY